MIIRSHYALKGEDKNIGLLFAQQRCTHTLGPFAWKCVGKVASGWSPGALFNSRLRLCEGDSEI